MLQDQLLCLSKEHSLASEANALQINSLQAELATACSERSQLEGLIDEGKTVNLRLEAETGLLQERLVEFSAESGSPLDGLVTHHCLSESKFSDFQLSIRELVKKVAGQLSSRQPTIFGDGGASALSVVLDEIVQEHLMSDESRLKDLQGLLDMTLDQLRGCNAELANSNEKVPSFNSF